ncbi:MAG TPA: hypothetical protein VKE69_04385 [Planctomycetota bacterium]|nr:hypothetical protein [Planctomycetota bacterium]
MNRHLAALLLLALPLGGCMTYRHDVGAGATQNIKIADQDQWWILWGLVPLSPSPSVDGGKLAANAGNPKDYTIETRYTPLDVLISLFTGLVSIHKQTVTIEK